MLLINLERPSRVPLHTQIVERIRGTIADRTLRPGERLPSTRRLADTLGVHRSTVATAYQQLWSLGFIDLRPCSRPTVRERMELAGRSDPAGPGRLDWRAVTSPGTNEILGRHRALPPYGTRRTGSDLISFASLDMDRRLFPIDHFRACVSKVLAKKGEDLLGYGDPAGYLPLREQVAHRMQQHGVSVEADEVLLTNGSQQGIDLTFRMVAAPGRSVAFESPTYNYMLPLLRFYGLKPLPISLGPDGMDLSALEKAIRGERPALIYSMPSFQNPSGVCTSQAHREELLALCEEHRIPLVEDGFEEEMQYSGRVVLPVKSIDRHRLVIYCGTFSKVLFPGVRIGWIAADRGCIERLTAIRRFGEVAPSSILQAAMFEFVRDGSYDRHVSKMHRVFRKRMQVALGALREKVSREWAEWTEPDGGYLIWLKLRTPAGRITNLDSRLAAHGVRVAPGRHFFCDETDGNYVRLSISTLDEDEIRSGVARLAVALQEVCHATV